MDQNAFRQLLVNSSSRRLQPNVQQATTDSKPRKASTSASSEPAFKPRKVKKPEGKYRDRAAERRDGIANEYAEVEAVLEDFEKRIGNEDKDVLEQQRKYLGGDSQHTILVRGLDMSLLEQNRARHATITEDDETLEQAFAEATAQSEPTEPKKRTRKEIIRDLKAKRQNGGKPESADPPIIEKSAKDTIETTKKAGKFKPIGLTEEKSKKRKVKDGKERVNKKKKQKVGSAPVQSGTDQKLAEETPQKPDIPKPSSSKTPQKPAECESTPLDEDFDIFTGAGDYQAFQDDEESEEDRDTEETREVEQTASLIPSAGAKGWFGEPGPGPRVRQASAPPPEKSPPLPEQMVAEEGPQEIRLKPLESSALPSIRDFLAMDEAADKAEKRRARKEKKKKQKAAGDDDD